MEAIYTTNLTKFYGKNRGIIDLNLRVAAGEFFGFIGPNGAGKSTTIRILLGLLRQSSGSASVFGHDILKDKQSVLKQIGYLPSEAIFYSNLRVCEVLKLSADLRNVDCAAETDCLCQRLRLDPTRKINELSYGNRKKVGIVCALQHRPKLLILDEPTSGLDPLMQRVFFSILQERNREGTTVFLSSHVLSEIQRYCTRAAMIRAGRLVACDQVEHLAKTNAKRVTVHGRFDFTKLDSVCDIQSFDNGASFLYSGSIDVLLGVLSTNHVTDLTITEPDLEEIFMHYYAGGGEYNDTDPA